MLVVVKREGPLALFIITASPPTMIISAPDDKFLFASLASKNPNTTRKIHLRKLYDILQLALNRRDFSVARRVWEILSCCPEINAVSLWPIGLQIVKTDSGTTQTPADFLRSMMLQCADDVRITSLFSDH